MSFAYQIFLRVFAWMMFIPALVSTLYSIVSLLNPETPLYVSALWGLHASVCFTLWSYNKDA